MKWFIIMAMLLTATTCEKKIEEISNLEQESKSDNPSTTNCISEEGYIFRYDGYKCYEITGRGVSAEEFQKCVEGYGWERIENHEIMKDGSLGREYEMLPQMWPMFYFFENGTVICEYMGMSTSRPYSIQDSIMVYDGIHSYVLTINEEYMDICSPIFQGCEITRMKRMSREDALKHMEIVENDPWTNRFRD